MLFPFHIFHCLTWSTTMLYGMCHGHLLRALCTHSLREKNWNVYERCEAETVSGTLKDHKDNREIFILKNVFFCFLFYAQVGTINLNNLLARQTPIFLDLSKKRLRRGTVPFITFLYMSTGLWHLNWCIKSKIWHFIVFPFCSLPFQNLFFILC